MGNSELRAQFRSLIALALVPEDDVTDAFDDLREDVVEELNPVFDYVEDNYVKGRRRGRGRMQPTFPPATWNCYDRTVGTFLAQPIQAKRGTIG